MLTTNLLCCIPFALLIAALGFAALPASAQTSPPISTDSTHKIAAVLQPFVDSHALAGAVTLVADKDRVLDVEAVGYADIAGGKPMKPNALFWIASESKPITAAALMMLVDEGKLNLNDPVEKYLPEFRGQWLIAEQDGTHQRLTHPAHPITIREILSHTAGLPFASAMENPTLDGLPLQTAVRSYAMTPLQYEPGTKYQYANAGINTAGRIIEVLSGMSYEQFLQTRLFDPLGMKDTTFWPGKAQLTRLAKSYKPNGDKTDLEETTVGQLKYPLNDRTARYPMPAGGLFSTAADLARFCRMVLNKGELDGKRYLSEASVQEMTRKQTGNLPDGYGLGWATGSDWYGHGGAYSTNMTIDAKRGLVLIYMVQHAGFPKNGDQSNGAFQNAAKEQFGKASQ